MQEASPIALLRMIGLPGENCSDDSLHESEDLLRQAHRHRLAMPYLLALRKAGRLMTLKGEFERRVSEFATLHDDVRALAHALELTGIQFVLLKTLRLYPENPNDIDILVFNNLDSARESLGRAVLELGYEPYKLAGNNRYNFIRAGKLGFKSPSSTNGAHRRDLDVYGEMMVEEYVFGDKLVLQNFASPRNVTNDFDGSTTTVPMLSTGADLFVVFWHSLFPTRRLGLEVVYTTLHSLQQFKPKDLDDFHRLVQLTGLSRQMSFCVGVVTAAVQQAFGANATHLLRPLQKGCGPQTEIERTITNEWPVIVPTRQFLGTAIAGLRFRKGRSSASAVVLKCVYPPYLANILRETLLVRLGAERYRLKH